LNDFLENDLGLKRFTHPDKWLDWVILGTTAAWFVILGVFVFDIEATCAAGIHEWAHTTFWLVLVLVIGFGSVATLSAVNAGAKDTCLAKTNPWLALALGVVFLAVFLITLIWGSIELDHAHGVAGCQGLWLLDLIWICYESVILIIFIVGIVSGCFDKKTETKTEGTA